MRAVLRFFTPYDPLAPADRLTTNIFQFLVFSIALYLLLSWDFSLGHFVGDESLNMPTRSKLYFIWKRPFYYYSAGLFVYNLFDLNMRLVLQVLQYFGILTTFFGLLGVKPKLSAIIAFACSLHISCLFISLGKTMDGSTTLLCSSLMILAISPKKNLYHLSGLLRQSKREDKGQPDFWPIYLMWLVFVAYYFGSGLNKLIVVGPSWGHWLDISAKAAHNLQADILYSASYSNTCISGILAVDWIGLVVSYHTLIIELLAPLLLFKFRFRNLFVVFFPLLHIGIYLILGYNYFLCSWIGLCLVDWQEIGRQFGRYRMPVSNIR